MNRVKWWQWILVYAALAISLAGAVPQYSVWIISLIKGVSPNVLPLAIEQNKLWEKNFHCTRSKEAKTVEAVTNVLLHVIVCPSSDVLVLIQRLNHKDHYRWIGLHTFEKTHSSHLAPNIRKAFAEGKPLRSDIVVAQAGQVLCQRWLDERLLLRRFQFPGGRCEDWVINTDTRLVVRRSPAPCDSNC